MPSKGQVNNPNGRPKGSKNERTEQWENLAEAIVTKHADRFNAALDKLDDKDFISSYIQVLNYFKPKYQSTEHNVGESSKITVNYERNPNRATRSTNTDTE